MGFSVNLPLRIAFAMMNDKLVGAAASLPAQPFIMLVFILPASAWAVKPNAGG